MVGKHTGHQEWGYFGKQAHFPLASCPAQPWDGLAHLPNFGLPQGKADQADPSLAFGI